MKLFTTALTAGLLAGSAFNALAESTVDYPTDYRSWHHIKSMVIEPGHPLETPFQGIHHVYANEAAYSAYTSDKKFPNGSVIVFDLLNYDNSDKTLTESDRKLIGVMKKDDQRKETGGWIFEAFKGNSTNQRIVDDGGQSCFGCHQSKEDDDFVFSSYRK